MSTHSHTGNNITTTMYRRKVHSSREMRYLSTEPQYMYYHKISEYEIKCRMHAHHVAPCAPSSRGELYRRQTLFLDDFPIFFYYPNGTWTHPPTSKLFLDFWNFFNFAKPLKAPQYQQAIKLPKNEGNTQSEQKRTLNEHSYITEESTFIPVKSF